MGSPLNAERGSFSFASNVTQASRQLRFVEWLRKSAQKNIIIMSKTPSSCTIHITYSASSSKKPSSHQGQVSASSSLSSLRDSTHSTTSTKAGIMTTNKTKSILKQKSEDDEFFSKHNRRVRLFLESEQTLL